jgi:pSer/pThr/pTyr-binding forkhead associated (FHA) protein
MPVLVLVFNNQPMKLFEIDKDKALTIGRREDNDICIPNQVVSGYHAKIDCVGDAFILTDLKSKNGTFVNNRRVETKWLDHNDKIMIGKHLLMFRYREDEARPKPKTRFDRTMVMEGRMQETLRNDLGIQVEGERVVEEPKATLVYLSGSGETYAIEKKLVRIGKNPQSDIVVKGLMVGQTAATITRRPEGFFLSYIEGLTKPKVNGETVGESVQLNDFDLISIGGLKLQFLRDKR